MPTHANARPQSPKHLRMSLAAAMTLGFAPGVFYREARLHCINLLLTYPSGCAARCAYCGLSGDRPGQAQAGSFIRVDWPVHVLEDIVEAIDQRRDRVKRVCLSMLANPRCVDDTRRICRHLREALDVPVSVLVSPTVLTRRDLESFREAGADKVGVAIDLATPELFVRYRGKGVGGPHDWDTYWNCLADAVDIFGRGMAGSHFMVGMGETERQMCAAIQRVRDMGGFTHLFSFFPEPGSAMAGHPQPPMEQYRRVQVARRLIDTDAVRAEAFGYDRQGRLTDFAVSPPELEALVAEGEAFRTSGCTGPDGEVACNRPYANSRPGPDIRNFPFKPDPPDIRRIRNQLRVPGTARSLAPDRNGRK